MQKSCCIISLMAMFLMFFISCTNEELIPHAPDGPVLNQGRVVFNVNTGKSTVYTRTSADDEQAIRSLGVFIVKPDGNLAEGITRFYEAEALTDKKFAVSIPVDIMETPGIKAYLVANGPDKTQCDGLKTEQEVLGLVATTKPEEIGTKGIPMASGAISLNFTGGIATVDANMKRVMSTLCAKVVKSKGVVVGPNDFTFKVHGVSSKEGYYFKDECKDTGIDQEWNSTSEALDEVVSLGYFYQSKTFQVEVVSKSTGQSCRIEIPLEKAQTRNKKYVLKIHPKPTSEGKGKFNVTVETWEAIETNIEFDKPLIIFNYPSTFFTQGKIHLDDNGYVETLNAGINLYSDILVSKGLKLIDVTLTGCLDEQKRGATIVYYRRTGATRLEVTTHRNLKTVEGLLLYTLEYENGVYTQVSLPVSVLPPAHCWNDEFKQETDDVSFKVVDGVLVGSIINDSVRKLSLNCKSIRCIGDILATVTVYAAHPIERVADIDSALKGELNGSDVEFTFNKSFKGYEGWLYSCNNSGSMTGMRFRFE